MVHGLETLNALNAKAVAAHEDKWVHVEHLDWYPVCPDHMPDADTTVMLYSKSASEPAWPGYFDSESESWRYTDGAQPQFPVTHWSEMPTGPKLLSGDER